MKVLIIGGCGYIGGALYKYLLPEHWIDTIDLEWFGNPLLFLGRSPNYKRDYGGLEPQELTSYDAVIVAAAHSSVSMCNGDPYGAFDNNVGNFVSLLRKLEAIKGNAPKLIYASSSCVYTGQQWNATESTHLLPPVDSLTLTKQTIDHYAKLSDIEFYGLRFGSVNGWSPNFRTDLMLNAMTLSAVKDGVVNVSNHESNRPIVGMNDLCRAVETILKSNKDQRGIYNIASFNSKIGDIGTSVARVVQELRYHKNCGIISGGNTAGYDFSMTSGMFRLTFGFEFQDTVSTIVSNILDNLPGGGIPKGTGGRTIDWSYRR